jgi:hypothetical protein
MPVVDGVLERRGVTRPFAESTVLVRTHLLLSTTGMLEAWGCPPERTHLFAKTHSTYVPAGDALKEQGYTVHSLTSAHGLPGAEAAALSSSRERWVQGGALK